jgi:hypothetical protein
MLAAAEAINSKKFAAKRPRRGKEGEAALSPGRPYGVIILPAALLRRNDRGRQARPNEQADRMSSHVAAASGTAELSDDGEVKSGPVIAREK